ncbi:hypothetical protein SAMN04488038_104125 [Solimonas aquatica]|uniref:Uncharacterized protein n=1 Tax=Solimonas aquatica TaxID=489703 RepID=A0A1H9DQ14_9GAMM|nr:hypothetical protein [Solimonas aquatica]SEQ15606.1 hypothetical protein SAMN04488038_104125 [Solimonas aquatica]
MKQDVLVMPRNLAIRLLHEAQIAQPEAIRGLVTARGEEPCAYVPGAQLPAQAELWAVLWSQPLAPAVPEAAQLREGELSLVISLNTKGVLEMRAWRLRDGQVQEQVLKIRD